MVVEGFRATLSAWNLAEKYQVRMPITEQLHGVLFENRSPRQATIELMTRENLITVREGVSYDEAKRLLHQHRIEKLLVVDSAYQCVGLITVKDIEKARLNPNAAKDDQGRLRVAAATTVGDKGHERSQALIDAGSGPILRRYGAR